MSTPVSSGDSDNSFLLNVMEFPHIPGLSYVGGDDSDGDSGDPSDGSCSSSSTVEDSIA